MPTTSPRWSGALLPLALAGAACDPSPPRRLPADVYVAGYQWVWTGGGSEQRARVWKNGVPLSQSDLISIATSVVVAGTTVYSAGCSEGPPGSGSYSFATVWRDGVAELLTDGRLPACVEALAVTEAGDVYAAGYEYGDARLWKNGVSQPLPHGYATSNAMGVAVSGEDVLAAGWMLMQTEIGPNSFLIAPMAVLWKNGGEPVSLGEPGVSSTARAIAVGGGSVHVAGHVATTCTAPCSAPYIATIWKDGVPQPLTDGRRGAVATCVAVEGGVAYAAGLQDNGAVDVATLWADGRTIRLGSGLGYGVGTAVKAAGGSVYVAGIDPTGPGYWKDGVAVPLRDTSGEILGLDVVVRGGAVEPPQAPEPAPVKPALAAQGAVPAFAPLSQSTRKTTALLGEPALPATALAGTPAPPYRAGRATTTTLPSGSTR